MTSPVTTPHAEIGAADPGVSRHADRHRENHSADGGSRGLDGGAVNTDTTPTTDTRRCVPCGKVYTMAEWLALPGAAGGSRMELSPGEWLELRNCACGGTMAEPGRPDVRRIRDHLGEIYVALVRLADTYASDEEKRASQEYAARVLRECRPKP